MESVHLKCYDDTCVCVTYAALVTMMMLHVGPKHVGDYTNVYREGTQTLLLFKLSTYNVLNTYVYHLH
jgi:hypothetical protein